MSRVAVRIRDKRGAQVAEVELTRYPAIIGRGREDEDDIDADVRLDDMRCSRSHALIERDDDGLWLTDQGSTNGTFSAEGKRVTKVRIRNRTRIRVGSHWLEFRVEADEDCTVVDPLDEPVPIVDQAPPPPQPEKPRTSPRAASNFIKPRAAPAAGGQDLPYAAPRVATFEPLRVEKPEEGPRTTFDYLEIFATAQVTAVLAVLFACARVAYWESGTVPWKCAAVLGTALVTGLAAALLAAITKLVARLFDRRPAFNRVWRAYVTLISVRQLCAWLVYDAALMWPERRVLDPWVPMFATAFAGLYLCLNARWISGPGTRRITAVATLWAVGMFFMYLPELKPQPPLWQRVVAAPLLNSQPRRMPASVQVPEDQFLHELSESLVVLQERK